MDTSNRNTKDRNVKFRILTLNVRGLRKTKKRRALFHSFKRENFDIICLQETHLTKHDSIMLDREWGINYHLAEGSHNSKGLLTLFSSNLAAMSKASLIKTNERNMVSSILIDSSIFYIVNIYAPCVEGEKASFLTETMNSISDLKDLETNNLIVLGDFNMVQDNNLDCISGEKHSKTTVIKFNTFKSNLLMTDIWRQCNGNRKEFTWSRKNPFIARRLDYIFTSESLLPFCKDSCIRNLGFSDHKAVVLSIDFSTFKRGSSSFKFNVSLLRETQLVNEITNEINRIKNLELDPHLCWEYIKVVIKDLGKRFGRMVAKRKKREKDTLNKDISDLEKLLISSPGDEVALQRHSELQQKLEIITIKETEGARIRAGLKWAQEGEKCNKYFLNLEKQRANNNTIFSIRDEANNLLTDPHEILENLKTHFENLYSDKNTPECNDDINEMFCDQGAAKLLDDSDIENLNKELTIEELSNALRLSKNGSAPGSDGLPGEIYKFFWKDLREPLISCFNYSFSQGILTDSQYTGTICLHHKGKGLDREKVNNWRPISLTNFDYKLLAKALAIRLNTCISKCVHEDQFAFIKGRQAADLIREIDDTISLGKTEFPESFIVSLDYAKAFDTLSTSAVKKMLTYFGIHGVFSNWIEIILKDRLSCIRNGGYFSDFFKMERGVRQGCPISPLLFIMTLEILARDIRKNDKIKGIRVNKETRALKIKMYADDATLFLRDLIDFREVLSRIKLFSYFSGLCLNKQKSSAMKIGRKDFKNTMKYGIKFNNRLKILGIVFSNECETIEIGENIDSRIEQLERICCLWQKRYLTLIGKITVLKSFGLSIFIYLMQSIGISEEKLKKINGILFRFIWNKKN